MIVVRSLPNGVACLLDRRPKAKTASIVIAIRGGASEEEYPGITHFLEHILSTRNPHGTQFVRQLDEIGRANDAFSSSDGMFLHCTVPARRACWAIERFVQLLVDPVFTEEDVARERSVILEEYHGDHDNSDSSLEMLRDGAIFARHPLGRSILGTATSLKQLTYSRVVEHWMRMLDPERMVVSVAGEFDPHTVMTCIRRQFGGLERPLHPLAQRRYRTPRDYPDRCAFRSFDLRQVNFCWTMLLPGYASRSRLACMVLSNILGDRESSLLFQQLRKQGSVYYVATGVWFFPEVGMLNIYGAVTRKNLHETLSWIHATLRTLRRNGISPEEFDLAVRSLRNRTKLRFADSLYAAKFHAGQYIAHGHVVSAPVFLGKLARLHRQSVDNAARRFFGPRSWHFSAIGPLTRRDKEKIRALIRTP